jgi:hypothetical protein
MIPTQDLALTPSHRTKNHLNNGTGRIGWEV